MPPTTDNIEAVTTGLSAQHMPTPMARMRLLTDQSVQLEDAPMDHSEEETVADMELELARKMSHSKAHSKYRESRGT